MENSKTEPLKLHCHRCGKIVDRYRVTWLDDYPICEQCYQDFERFLVGVDYDEED